MALCHRVPLPPLNKHSCPIICLKKNLKIILDLEAYSKVYTLIIYRHGGSLMGSKHQACCSSNLGLGVEKQVSCISHTPTKSAESGCCESNAGTEKLEDRFK